MTEGLQRVSSQEKKKRSSYRGLYSWGFRGIRKPREVKIWRAQDGFATFWKDWGVDAKIMLLSAGLERGWRTLYLWGSLYWR